LDVRLGRGPQQRKFLCAFLVLRAAGGNVGAGGVEQRRLVQQCRAFRLQRREIRNEISIGPGERCRDCRRQRGEFNRLRADRDRDQHHHHADRGDPARHGFFLTGVAGGTGSAGASLTSRLYLLKTASAFSTVNGGVPGGANLFTSSILFSRAPGAGGMAPGSPAVILTLRSYLSMYSTKIGRAHV